MTDGGNVCDCGRNSTTLATLNGERSPFGTNSFVELRLKPDGCSDNRGTNSRTEAKLKEVASVRGTETPASLLLERSRSCSRGEADEDALLVDTATFILCVRDIAGLKVLSKTHTYHSCLEA